jgi:multidrug efflux pump subunit AcrB
MIQAPEGASFDHLANQATRIEAAMQPYFDSGEIQRGIISMPGFGNQAGIIMVTLKTWGEREVSTDEMIFSRPRIREISEVSSAVRGLQAEYRIHRICFPAELKDEIGTLYHRAAASQHT